MLSGQTLNSDEEICLIKMQKTDIYKASNSLLCLPKQIIIKNVNNTKNIHAVSS